MSSFLSRIGAGLSSLLYQANPEKPTISSYGQGESGLELETIQKVMEWLFASLFNAQYFGQSHLFWLHTQEDPKLKRQLRQLHKRGEPVLGYRCGDRTPEPPSGYYWRLMSEHPSLRIYQLEEREDD